MGSDRKNFPAGDSHADVSNKLCHHLHQEKEATNRESCPQRIIDWLPMRHGGFADLPGVDGDLQRYPEQHAKVEKCKNTGEDIGDGATAR